mmetsp:Transcript_19871/g.17563  ORF Transcript_19871/g.17563 Transcript_19871/m.17563 type:complete len:82 (+) Transcript_19871:161-406(+)
MNFIYKDQKLSVHISKDPYDINSFIEVLARSPLKDMFTHMKFEFCGLQKDQLQEIFRKYGLTGIEISMSPTRMQYSSIFIS